MFMWLGDAISEHKTPEQKIQKLAGTQNPISKPLLRLPRPMDLAGPAGAQRDAPLNHRSGADVF